jgi:hypothetical protein
VKNLGPFFDRSLIPVTKGKAPEKAPGCICTRIKMLNTKLAEKGLGHSLASGPHEKRETGRYGIR